MAINNIFFEKMFKFSIIEYGNKTKLYKVQVKFEIYLPDMLEYANISDEQLDEQIEIHNGLIMENNVIFLTRKDAELFIDWLDSIKMIRMLRG